MSWPWPWPLTFFKVKVVAERGTTILRICLFISQPIRCARACLSYECFILRAVRPSCNLFWQGYGKERLKSPLRKFYGRYGDLIKHYVVPLSQMVHDFLGHDHIQWHPQLIRHVTKLWLFYQTEPYHRFWCYYLIREVFIWYGAASQQRTLIPPKTWSYPILNLHLFLCLDHSFLNLSCLRTFWVSILGTAILLSIQHNDLFWQGHWWFQCLNTFIVNIANSINCWKWNYYTVFFVSIPVCEPYMEHIRKPVTKQTVICIRYLSFPLYKTHNILKINENAILVFAISFKHGLFKQNFVFILQLYLTISIRRIFSIDCQYALFKSTGTKQVIWLPVLFRMSDLYFCIVFF